MNEVKNCAAVAEKEITVQLKNSVITKLDEVKNKPKQSNLMIHEQKNF